MTEPTLTPIPFDAFLLDIEMLAQAIEADEWRPHFLVGIGRGGLVPAAFLSHRTGLPMLSVDHSSRVHEFADALLERLAERMNGGERILFVDDINDSGATLRHLDDAIRARCGQPEQARVAVLINNTRSSAAAHYWSRAIDRAVVKDWFVFPWEQVADRAAVVAEAQSVPERWPDMRICVFLGSSLGMSPVYAEAARRLGTLMAERGIGLVYGGGQVGLMGVIADAVLDAGGEAIGVIPDSLRAREGDHPNLKQLIVTQTMHQRKAKMAELCDGCITLPGGIGTLEELFETWTWAQLGLHAKPCGLLNVNGFYETLSGFIDHVVDEGFLQARHRHMMMIEREPALLLDRMAEYLAPETEKFLKADDF